MLGINRNPRKQRPADERGRAEVCIEILQHLGDQFACGRSAHLQKMQRGIVDMFRTAPVMVYHHHAPRRFNEPRRNQRTDALGIHDYENACRAYQALRLLGRDEHAAVHMVLTNQFQRAVDHSVVVVQHDESPCPRLFDAGGNAQRRADAVHIRPFVADDHYVPGVFKHLPERLAEEPHLHAGLHGLRLAFAAVKHISAAFFDDGLISPAPERNLHCLPRAFVRTRNAVVCANGDGERNLHARAGFYGVRLLQKRKALFFEFRQRACFKNDEEAPVFVPAVDAVERFHHFGDQPLHLAEHAGTVERNIRRQFFIVVYIDQCHIRHLFFKQALIMRRLGAVDPILKHQFAVVLFPVGGYAHHLINAAGELHWRCNERRGKVEVRLNQANIRVFVKLFEYLVTPDDLAARFNKRAGNGNAVDQFSSQRGIFGKHIVHLLLSFARPVELHAAADDQQQDNHAERHAGYRQQHGLNRSGEEQQNTQQRREYADRQQTGFSVLHFAPPGD
ncbi:hypothetical protein SDC9_91130 [bioreactor metagenome]|uniref:Uncharacterized protein n=1 Tax=bioreactor metagenome TaxID=1076179 RepID=A0A644ZUB8_9ZZZZ